MQHIISTFNSDLSYICVTVVLFGSSSFERFFSIVWLFSQSYVAAVFTARQHSLLCRALY